MTEQNRTYCSGYDKTYAVDRTEQKIWVRTAQNMKHIGVNPTENQNTAVHRADAHVAHADDDDEREFWN